MTTSDQKEMSRRCRKENQVDMLPMLGTDAYDEKHETSGFPFSQGRAVKRLLDHQMRFKQ